MHNRGKIDESGFFLTSFPVFVGILFDTLSLLSKFVWLLCMICFSQKPSFKTVTKMVTSRGSNTQSSQHFISSLMIAYIHEMPL